MNQRISNLRNKMKAQNLKAVLINNLKNVYYLTNFWGSNGTALVTEERVVLFTDSRYTIHAHATCFPFVEIVETRDELTAAAEIVKDLGGGLPCPYGFCFQWHYPSIPSEFCHGIALD